MPTQRFNTRRQLQKAGVYDDIIRIAKKYAKGGGSGGTGVIGKDGREIELQKSATHIQWRYVGGSWTDLIALSELKGEDGEPGSPGEDGIGTVETVGTLINSATEKTTPVDADMIGLMDSGASNILKKLSWANIKSSLRTYFDTLFLKTDQSTTQTVTGTPVFGNSIKTSGVVTETTPYGDIYSGMWVRGDLPIKTGGSYSNFNILTAGNGEEGNDPVNLRYDTKIGNTEGLPHINVSTGFEGGYGTLSYMDFAAAVFHCYGITPIPGAGNTTVGTSSNPFTEGHFGDIFVSGNLSDGTNTGTVAKLAGIEAGAEVNNISDADATDLTDGGDTTLHTHDIYQLKSTTHSVAFVIPSPATTDDVPLIKIPVGITITSVASKCIGGTNVVWQLQEYDNDAANPADTQTTDTTTTTSQVVNSTFSNASIDANDWLGIKVTSISGSVGLLVITVYYTID